jgi:hypothetical protein
MSAKDGREAVAELVANNGSDRLLTGTKIFSSHFGKCGVCNSGEEALYNSTIDVNQLRVAVFSEFFNLSD